MFNRNIILAQEFLLYYLKQRADEMSLNLFTFCKHDFGTTCIFINCYEFTTLGIAVATKPKLRKATILIP